MERLLKSLGYLVLAIALVFVRAFTLSWMVFWFFDLSVSVLTVLLITLMFNVFIHGNLSRLAAKPKEEGEDLVRAAFGQIAYYGVALLMSWLIFLVL